MRYHGLQFLSMSAAALVVLASGAALGDTPQRTKHHHHRCTQCQRPAPKPAQPPVPPMPMPMGSAPGNGGHAVIKSSNQ